MTTKKELLIRIINLEDRVEMLEEDNNSLTRKLKKAEKTLKEINERDSD